MPDASRLKPDASRRCDHHDPALWQDEAGELRWDVSLLAYVWLPSHDGNKVRTTCRRCGGFIGFRPREDVKHGSQ